MPNAQRAIPACKCLVASVAALVAAIPLAGCGGPRPAGAPPREVNSGLARLNDSGAAAPINTPVVDPSEAEKERLVARAALDLEKVFATANAEPSGASDGAGDAAPSAPPAAASEPEAPVFTAQPGEPSAGLASLASDTPASTPAETAPPLPADPIVDLAKRMAGLLAERDQNGKPVLTDFAAMLPLETMRPGAVAAINDPSSPLFAELTEQERKTLSDARARLLASPNGASEDFLVSLRGAQGAGVRIARSVLCTRVEGFGRFDPYPAATFVAGQPTRAIVYVEVEGFEARPARESDPVQRTIPLDEQVAVDLSQELALFHDPDGLLAWRRPHQGVVEVSRSKRRDFYLTQMIELPRTLSIGRYNLKVTVLDRTSGSQAQAIIPIEVVADPTLVRQGP
ncbi:MAG TPA: hypothetical protein VD971_03965 [Phycisphaerales bacterium]|nr:hypothetical protein [Phycisphaerales bacterium]